MYPSSQIYMQALGVLTLAQVLSSSGLTDTSEASMSPQPTQKTLFLCYYSLPFQSTTSYLRD